MSENRTMSVMLFVLGSFLISSYEKGKIAYDEFMRLDIALWKPRPQVKTIKRILLDYNLVPNAKHVVNILKKKKYHVVLITTLNLVSPTL